MEAIIGGVSQEPEIDYLRRRIKAQEKIIKAYKDLLAAYRIGDTKLADAALTILENFGIGG